MLKITRIAQIDLVKALIEAAWGMLDVEASACMRSEAVGETGMRERFTALRQAVRAVDPQEEEWPDPHGSSYEGIGPPIIHGIDGDEDFPYGR